jgi:ATP-dependent HslUV protease subunit HslV
VRKGEEVVMLADGQVTMGGSILKPNVKKTRKIGDKVMGGFAGATADAFTLFERLETKLEEHPSQLTRAAVELAKMWRMDKYLRRLDVRMCLLSSYCMVLWIGKSRTNWCKREINKQVKNYDVCRLPL